MNKIPIETTRYLDNDVMTFLSQSGIGRKDTVSFGSGKPDKEYFDLDKAFVHIRRYFDFLQEQGLSESEWHSTIGQYTHVKGIIPDMIKKYWETDYDGFGTIDEKNILLTVGTQEAFALAILRLCEQGKHTILTENPTYIGFNSFAKLNGYEVAAVEMDESGGLNIDQLQQQLEKAQANGQPVRLLYLIPDFHNPTGTVMPLSKRKQVIELAEQWDFFIFEDNAYKVFQYEGQRLPCLKELDVHHRVIYAESFSKSVFPSIRTAAMYVTGGLSFNGQWVEKIDLLAELKAYISVNNPTLDQALIAGILLENDFSIRNYNQKKVAAIQEKRDLMVLELQKHIPTFPLPITFNIPEGGFFLELCLPFAIDEAQLKVAIEEYQIIFCPIWFFYHEGNKASKKSIRLSFSQPSKEMIVRGVQNLFNFFNAELL